MNQKWLIRNDLYKETSRMPTLAVMIFDQELQLHEIYARGCKRPIFSYCLTLSQRIVITE